MIFLNPFAVLHSRARLANCKPSNPTVLVSNVSERVLCGELQRWPLSVVALFLPSIVRLSDRGMTSLEVTARCHECSNPFSLLLCRSRSRDRLN
jgi:hypothetical protein